MAAIVDDAAVKLAAEALLEAASSITTAQGLKIRPNMTLESAKQHVMSALVFSLGHYAHSLGPSGWTELKQWVSTIPVGTIDGH